MKYKELLKSFPGQVNYSGSAGPGDVKESCFIPITEESAENFFEQRKGKVKRRKLNWIFSTLSQYQNDISNYLCENQEEAALQWFKDAQKLIENNHNTAGVFEMLENIVNQEGDLGLGSIDAANNYKKEIADYLAGHNK